MYFIILSLDPIDEIAKRKNLMTSYKIWDFMEEKDSSVVHAKENEWK